MEKVIKDGKVAILYSPGFGAGWSTWNDDTVGQKMIFHPKLVELVEEDRQNEITEEFVQTLFNTKDYICILGASDLRITWLPEGTSFYIDEYDGSESIVTSDRLSFRS